MVDNGEQYLDRDEIFARLKWAMFLRVVAVTLLLGATAALQLRAGSSPFAVSLVRIYTLIGVTYVFTAASGILLVWVKNPRPFAYFQVCYEILLITALISVTGRLFSFVYILGILSASIILHRFGAFAAAALGSLSYGALLVGVGKYGESLQYLNRDFVEDVRSLGSWEIGYNIGIDITAFFLVASLASYLTEKLRRTGMELAEREEDLEDLEEWNENIIRSLSSGLVTVNQEGMITSFNRAAEEITGREASGIIGRPLEELFPEISLENCPPEITYKNAERKVRHLVLSLSVLRSGKGMDVGRILTFNDQTAYREMEEQLKISDRLAAVGQLAAGLAHEVRNPLASISGSIQILRRDKNFRGDDRLLRILLRETERLNQLISEFLHFARPTSGEIKEVDLKEMLEENVELFKHQVRGRGSIKTTLVCPDNIKAYLDLKLLHQVLWNLLINARDALQGGGEISLLVEEVSREPNSEAERKVRITVSDTGPGIDPELHKKVFTPFFTTKEYGTGLGLATVFRSVESMGGWIRLISEPGEGATFIIELPMMRHVEPQEISREAVN